MMQDFPRSNTVKARLALVQNIVTSYRIDLFNEIASQLNIDEWRLEVLYYRERYRGRFLPFSLDDVAFDYHVYGGLFLRVRGWPFHFNPGLIWDLSRKRRDDHIILGVSWNDVNVVLICILKRMGVLRAKVSVWSEANFMARERLQGSSVRSWCRKWVLGAVDGAVVVPGRIAERTVRSWGYTGRVVYLPNLVNSAAYEAGHKSGQINDVINCVIIARLTEQDKGIARFLDAVPDELRGSFKITIAGDGPDRQAVERVIKNRGMRNEVVLLGNVNRERVRTLLREADLFVLPSLSDPNPISVIEALHSGLPLMISNRCGNVVEAVDESRNGISFDPFDQSDVYRAMRFFEDNRGSLGQMGARSRTLAQSNFSLAKRVRMFLGQLLGEGALNL